MNHRLSGSAPPRRYRRPVPRVPRLPSTRLRASLAVVAAAVAGLAALAMPTLGLPSAVAAAAVPELSVTTATRYDVRPDENRIDVTVGLTATNNRVDTPTTRYIYQQAFLAVQPEATGFAVSSTMGRPAVSVDDTKPTHTLLRITFGTPLAAGASIHLTLTYGLPDPGEPYDRDFRVGPTLTTFRVWALASSDTPGSTVTLTAPAGYTLSFTRGSLAGPTTDGSGRQIWASVPIPDALKFDVFVRVERPPELVDSPLDVPVEGGVARLTLRAWSDDPAWADRIGGMLRDGIPALEAAIGRPWPLAQRLTVEEVLEPVAGGIAGTFEPALNRIQVVFGAGPEVALHEAAHAWFNGGFLADRWANEAFASYYAEVAAAELGLPFRPAAVTPELEGAHVPLNAWAVGGAQPPQGAERSAVEAYGYAASAELARRIAERVGPATLRRLWTEIDAGRAAYQPPAGPIEFLTAPPDWQGLLDLIEEDGRSRVADLWLTLVVLPDQARMLVDRDAARRAYAEAIDRSGDWRLPSAIRDWLRAWDYATALPQLATAVRVLDARDELLPAAATEGLELPGGLRDRFMAATDMATIEAEVTANLEAVAAIRAARRARPSSPDAIEWLGLAGASPTGQLAAATTALAEGDAARATALASSAELAWQGARDAGQTRFAFLTGLMGVAAALALGLVRRRRRRPGDRA